MSQNEEGSGTEWIYVLVPQTRLTQTKRKREEEKDNQKSSKQLKYSKYIEKGVRMHGDA